MGRARRAWAASTLLQPTVGCGEKAEKPASAGRPGRVSALPGCGARLASATPQERTRRPGIEQRAQQRAPGAGPGAVSEACATDTRQIWAGRTGLGKIKGWSCTEPARPETTQGAPEPASRPVVLGGTDTAAGTPPAHVAPRERLPNDKTEGQPGLSRFPASSLWLRCPGGPCCLRLPRVSVSPRPLPAKNRFPCSCRCLHSVVQVGVQMKRPQLKQTSDGFVPRCFGLTPVWFVLSQSQDNTEFGFSLARVVSCHHALGDVSRSGRVS